MSILDRVARTTGLYDYLQPHFFDAKVICGHDYCADWPGVIQSVDESGGVAEIVENLWLLKGLSID